MGTTTSSDIIPKPGVWPAQATTLKIATKLGAQQDSGDSGHLLLQMIQGVEGVSMPFSYDVTLLRYISDGDINVRQLINTPAVIGMRGRTDIYTFRRGVILNLEKDETNKARFEDGEKTNFEVFKAKIVPALKLLDYEVRYRVFENLNVLQVLEEVMDGFADVINFKSYVSTQFLTKGPYPLMKYCVQYGETSLAFIHRLLDQFNLWYYFDHDDQNYHDLKIETMILGDDPPNFKDVMFGDMNVVSTPPGVKDISGFQRHFMPAHKHVWAGNYNLLNPADPPRGDVPVNPDYDLLPGSTDPTPYGREVFPGAPTAPDQISLGIRNTAAEMAQLAENQIENEEVNTFTVQGQCRQPTFFAGKTFGIVKDTTGAVTSSLGVPSHNEYLITQLSFAAVENTYGHHTHQDVLNWLDSPIRWIWGLFRQENNRQGVFLDPLAALASGGLGTIGDKVTAASTALNLTTTLVQGLMQSFISSAPKEIISWHSDSYANAFTAIPYDLVKYKYVPGPDAVKPHVYGPELAIVVGPKGNQGVTDGGPMDIYTDGLGRVRIRFPWQRIVSAAKYRSAADQAQASKPLESDYNTCWVSVSEGWAGRSFGTQFLPRIGQEVIVSFIDGDPERPIITGRRYNADKGISNMPFPPGQSMRLNYTVEDWYNPTPSSDVRFSGLKTAAMPQPSGGKSRYHLMRYDDTYNCEQLLMRSQGRLDVTAYANSFETTHGNKNVTTVQGTDSNGKPFGGNMFTTVGQEYDLHVGTNRFEQVEKDYEITVKGNVRADLEKNVTAVIKGDVSVAVNSLVLEATEKITLKVGQSSIVIDHCSIYINAPSMIYENSGGSATGASAVTLQNVADATLAEPGDEWNKRLTPCDPAGPPGGSRTIHTVTPTPASPCSSVVGGVSCDFLPPDC